MKNVIGALRGRAGIRGAFAFALCALWAVSAACEDDDGPTGIDVDVETVEFTTTGPVNLEVGSTSQLAFEIRDADGDLIDPDDVDVVFSSSSQTIATVSTTGLITPVAPGAAVITIGVGTISDAITVRVELEISSIDIIGDDEVDLVSGETSTFNITVLNAAGNLVGDAVLTFTTSNADVVTVTGQGRVTAVSVGTATITVAGGGESDSIDVTVFAAASGGISLGGNAFTAFDGDAITINDLVTVRDAGGVIIPDAELTFATTDAAVATVDAAGLLTALATGEALITVTSPDATGSATFRLTVLEPGIFDAIRLEPSNPTIAVAAIVDLDIVAELDFDRIDDFLAVFTSSDVTVATVDPFTGLVTGISAGIATITATNGSVSVQSVITVE